MLFGSLIIPFLGVVAWLHLQETSIEKMMKGRLADDSEIQLVTVLSFAKTDLHLLDWEHDHEFEYQHIMFDVIRQEESKDSIAYYCIADHEESKLKAAVNDLLARALGQPLETGQQTRLSIFLRALVCPVIHHYTYTFRRLPTKVPALVLRVCGRNAAAPVAPPPKYC